MYFFFIIFVSLSNAPSIKRISIFNHDMFLLMKENLNISFCFVFCSLSTCVDTKKFKKKIFATKLTNIVSRSVPHFFPFLFFTWQSFHVDFLLSQLIYFYVEYCKFPLLSIYLSYFFNVLFCFDLGLCMVPSTVVSRNDVSN